MLKLWDHDNLYEESFTVMSDTQENGENIVAQVFIHEMGLWIYRHRASISIEEIMALLPDVYQDRSYRLYEVSWLV